MKAEVYWVEVPNVRLAIFPRPRGGDYLEDEIKSLREQGVDVLVSLLTYPESRELDLEHEADFCARHSIRFIPFPVEDRTVPKGRAAAAELVQVTAEQLRRGIGVGIHCRAGIGRSAMIAAAALYQLGYPVDEAFDLIGAARGCRIPDTSEQRAWVAELDSIGG